MTKKRTYVLKGGFTVGSILGLIFGWAYVLDHDLEVAGALGVVSVVCAILANVFKDGTQYEEQK